MLYQKLDGMGLWAIEGSADENYKNLSQPMFSNPARIQHQMNLDAVCCLKDFFIISSLWMVIYTQFDGSCFCMISNRYSNPSYSGLPP